jgi:hypothetical protein
MSNIIFNNIDVTFPIAGQDNPSKGFRDNWSYIQSALATAKSEITSLETTALLKHSLTNSTIPAENNLGQSTIINGSHKEFYGSSYTQTPDAADTVISVNVADGDAQQINLLHTAVSILFTGWPEGNQYAKVRLHLSNSTASALTVSTFTSQAALAVKKDNLFPSPFSVATNKHLVVEAWSFNNGSTVFLKYLGDF